MLRYVVDRTLDGRTDELKEYALGVDVFGRGASFDPRVDTIVRVQARRLRSKLEGYYNTEGRMDPVLIEIPKGRYIISFRQLPPRVASPPTASAATSPDTIARADASLPSGPVGRRRFASRSLLGLLAAVAALSVIAVGSLLYSGTGRKGAKPPAITSLAVLPLETLMRWDGSPAPVIAVLPFANLSVEPDSEYFVDGLTDEIIRNLAVIDGLTVRSHTSSFTFKNKPHHTREIGAALQANLVLEGSVLRDGVKLRVNAQLVRVSDDQPLWSGRFDRELKDVFAIQDEISRSIVNQLRLKLGRGQRRYSTSVEAYDLFLKARVLETRRGDGIGKALELFREVMEKDPSFVPAYAGFANATAELSLVSDIPEDQPGSELRTAALGAIELDPLLAEAQAAVGHVHACAGEWSEAEQSFRRALELNPSLTTTYTDFVLSTLLPEGKLDEAMRLLEAALRADPRSLDVRRVLANVQLSAGLYDRALENSQWVLAVDPTFPYVSLFRARALLFQGHKAEAVKWLESLAPDGIGFLGYAYAVSGRRAEAEALAGRSGDPDGALIYAGLGDRDRAFNALQKFAALNRRRAGMHLTKPELATLRGDPRMAALRAQLGLPR